MRDRFGSETGVANGGMCRIEGDMVMAGVVEGLGVVAHQGDHFEYKR